MTKKLLAGFSVLFASFLLGADAAFAVQGLLTDDAYVSASKRNAKLGSGATLRLGAGSTALIKFDLSILPAGVAGADIEKATLILFVSQVGAAGTFNLVRIMSDWQEATVDYDSLPLFGRIEAPSVPIARDAAKNFIAIDVTRLVRDWLDGRLDNNGVALAPDVLINMQFDAKKRGVSSHEAKLDITLAAPTNAGPARPSGPAGPPGPPRAPRRPRGAGAPKPA